MRNIILIFYSAYVWCITALFFTLHFIIAGITYPFSSNGKVLHMRLTKPFITIGFWLCGFKLSVSGTENIPKNSYFMVVSNHQSLVDILVFMKALPSYFSFFAKQELLKVPLLGWDIQIQDHFVVDRSSARTASRQLDTIRKRVEKGRSVLIFPEGTRSETGKIAPFKRGAFMLAAQTGVNILPAYIEGTRHILKKKSLLFSPTRIHVHFLPSIPVKKGESKKEFSMISDQVMTQTFMAIHDYQKQGI